MSNHKIEAEILIEAIFDDYGTGGLTRGEVPYIDGKQAILEMKNDNIPGWQEVEWAGYHIKYLLQKTLNEKVPGQIQVISQKKRQLFKGNFMWDIRFHADSDTVILGDVDEYNEIMSHHDGIGVMVVDAFASYDAESFREWHENLKGGSSEYTHEREMEGRPVHPRKTAYVIKKILAYYFPYKDFQRGCENGWVTDTFQKGMRNSNGTSRNAKYRLKLYRIPNEYLLCVKNFNEDPEEFALDYPGFT